jgi:hypothetical protein
MGCKTLHFLKPGADGPPDRLGLAKLLTCATQPGLVSPGGGDQAQWYPPVLQEALRLALAEFHGIYCVCDLLTILQMRKKALSNGAWQR